MDVLHNAAVKNDFWKVVTKEDLCGRLLYRNALGKSFFF